MTGELDPTIGEVTRNRFLRVGKYSQHFVDVLPMDKSPIEYLQSAHNDLTYQQARNLLGRFGLEGHAHGIPSKDLSGGQKARVVFAGLSLAKSHILIMVRRSQCRICSRLL
jgi:ATP-binding cassette, subfamily F, member 1